MSLTSLAGSESMAHAIVVHFPIVLAFLGIPLVLACALIQRDRHTLRWIALACYVLLVVSCWVSVSTGEGARDHMPPDMAQEVWDLLEEHEEMAEKAWLISGFIALCIGVSFSPVPRIRLGAIVIACLASFGCAAWLGGIGHRGGHLVYQYGVGTPAMKVEVAAAAPAQLPVTMTDDADPGEASATTPDPLAAAPDPSAAVAVDVPVADTVPAHGIDIAEAAKISFVRDVYPLIETHCIDCHEGEKAKGQYDMASVATMVLAGRKAGPGVIPGNPDESAIIQYMRGELKPRMPKGEDPLPEDTISVFRMWIAAGAMDDTSGVPVAPPAVQVPPKRQTVADRAAEKRGDTDDEPTTPPPAPTPDAAVTPEPDQEPAPAPEPAQASEPSIAPIAPTPAEPAVAPEPEPVAAVPTPAAPDKLRAALDIVTLAAGGNVPESTAPAPPPVEPQPSAPAPSSESAAPAEPSAQADEFVPALRPIDIEAAKTVSYVRDIKPVVDEFCISCHDVEKPKSNYDMSTVATMVLAGKKGEPNIVAGKPDDSGLIHYLRGIKKPQMPKGEPPLTEDQLHLFRQWIAAGAVDDSGQTPVATEGTQNAQLDEETRRLFSFDGDPVEKLVERRRVRFALVAAPPAAPSVGAGVSNAIDSFIAAKWQEASPGFTGELCDDTAFLRRVYLDVIGVAPTAEEARAFAASPSPNKRAELIDTVLARNDEYAAHWVPFWEDALCSNGNHQGGVGTRGNFRDWIYEAFRENRPYDLMVAQLIDTAFPGSPGRFVLRQDRTQILKSAADTAQVFLGTSLKCASCHNHFENREWTQSRFLGYAGLFTGADLELIRCEATTGQMVPTSFLFDLPNAPTDVPATEAERLSRCVQLLVDPTNPRFSKTLVNRLWKRLLGLGLFEPADDFRTDRPASHPELLDWLAYDFMVNGYDIKHTLRQILNSRTYQLKYDAALEDHYEASKPDAPRYFRSPSLRRLTAEQALDSIALALNGEPLGAGRLYRNDESTPLTRSLGRPATRNEVSTARPDDVAVVQALEMLNGDELYDRIYVSRMAERAANELLGGRDANSVVDHAYWSLLARAPTDQEQALGKVFLTDALAPFAAATAQAAQPNDVVWFDDSAPAGVRTGGTQGDKTPLPFVDAPAIGRASGSKVLGLTLQPGEKRRHHFTNATPPLEVRLNDVVFLHLFIDPANAPESIQIEWRANGWDHRAVWGNDPTTNESPQFAAPMPNAGAWVRIEIPAEQLGLGGVDRAIDGLSITQRGGTAYYDNFGITRHPLHPASQAVGDMLWALATSPEFQYIR